MKVKLLCAAIALTLSANSFALELYKAKVVKHKEWTTGGNIKVMFKPAANARAMLTLPGLKSTPNDGMYIGAMAFGGQGTTQEPVTVMGSNYIVVQNDTQDTQEYQYLFGVCVNTDEHTAQCSYYQDTVDVDAGGSFGNGANPSVMMQFDQAGTYSTQSFTQIFSSQSMTASASGTGSILVTDSNQNAKK